MFANFQDNWPALSGAHRANGMSSRATESVAGESVAATESDVTGTASTVDGRGGVSLAGLTIDDAKHASMSQSDRLKRFVESQDESRGNYRGYYNNGAYD